jgi:hypothetical protein
VPFDEVPRDATHEEQVQWLYDWWERIDAWITENRPGETTLPVLEDPALEHRAPENEEPAPEEGGDQPAGTVTT